MIADRAMKLNFNEYWCVTSQKCLAIGCAGHYLTSLKEQQAKTNRNPLQPCLYFPVAMFPAKHVPCRAEFRLPSALYAGFRHKDLLTTVHGNTLSYGRTTRCRVDKSSFLRYGFYRRRTLKRSIYSRVLAEKLRRRMFQSL